MSFKSSRKDLVPTRSKRDGRGTVCLFMTSPILLAIVYLVTHAVSAYCSADTKFYAVSSYFMRK